MLLHHQCYLRPNRIWYVFPSACTTLTAVIAEYIWDMFFAGVSKWHVMHNHSTLTAIKHFEELALSKKKPLWSMAFCWLVMNHFLLTFYFYCLKERKSWHLSHRLCHIRYWMVWKILYTYLPNYNYGTQMKLNQDYVLKQIVLPNMSAHFVKYVNGMLLCNPSL